MVSDREEGHARKNGGGARSEAGPYISGITARLNTKALIVSPTSAALAFSVVLVAESAGKLMSMPE